MLKLYVKTECPYCAVVLHKVDELGVQVKQLNIADDEVAGKLIELGGKRQVPYLVDEERGVSMYESQDIVDYLDEHYAKSEKSE